MSEQPAHKAQQRALDAQRRLEEQSAQLSTEERARLEAERKQAEEAAARARAEAQVQTERAARVESQARADEALRRLEQTAQVREEARGRVITLNGSVIFASGTATILPSARQRLDDLATALKSERNAQFIIEGYTDSRGREETNLRLSQARAAAVRDYLVAHGVDDTRVRAIGRGEDNPIATNATAEGRANNRRVEIVINRREALR